MKRTLIAISGCLFVTALNAQPATQPPAPPYVPFTVQKSDAEQLRSYLDEQPMKFALPLLQWITGLEQRAVMEKAAIDKAAADAKVKEQADKAAPPPPSPPATSPPPPATENQK